MAINMIVLGLVLDIIGVFLLAIISIINPHYWRREDLKFWQKRYSWHAWRPLYKDTQTKKWKMSLKRMPIIDGFVPPKRKIELIGLIFILIGFLLQLIFYLA